MSNSPTNTPRRIFVIQGSWLMGGVAMSGLFPGSLLASSRATCYVNANLYPDACGDWTLDHVCAAWPPYAFHTGPAQPHNCPCTVGIANIDRHWLI